MAYSCVYLESNFYTACDCDGNGERRAEWGPDWWREYTHCEEFTCLYVRQQQRDAGRETERVELSGWARLRDSGIAELHHSSPPFSNTPNVAARSMMPATAPIFFMYVVATGTCSRRAWSYRRGPRR